MSYSVALLGWLLLHLCSNARSQAPQVTPVGGAAQDANTIDTFSMSFNITPADIPPSSIYWTFLSQGITTNITNSSFRTLSADMRSITLNPVITQHEGVYTLVAISGGQQGSASITLNVRSVGFLKNPQDITEHERQNATFDCFGTGEPTPTVTWFFNGMQLQTTGNSKYGVAGFGDSNFGALTIFNLVYNDHGTYTCMVSNGFKAINDSAILQVQEFPVIRVAPDDTNTTAGGLARLYCNATGFPIPEIAWFKNNTPIAELNDPRITVSRTEVAENLIAVGVLSIQGPVLSHNGMYSCNASNSLKTADEVSSDTAVLNVQYPPSVTVNTAKVTVNQTFPASFSCEAFGRPPPSLQWISSITNSAVQPEQGSVNIIMNSFINGSDLEIRTSSLVFNSTVRSQHEANYTCRAQNGIQNYISSSSEAAVELIVQVPPITRFPGNNQNQELGIVHQQVTITIAVDNASPDVLPAHTGWQFKGVNAGTVTVLENSKHMFSADRRSLTITDLSHDDEGQYTVTVRNPAGSDMITVNLAIEAAPEIIESPQNDNVLQGANTTLNCNATSEPTHSVIWSKNNMVINITDKYSISNSSFSRSLSSSLTIHNVDMGDTANYTCTVTNVHGNQTATAYIEIQVPPVVQMNPVSVIGIVGESSTLVCQTSGSPVPSIQWKKDGQNVTGSGRISIVTLTNGLVRTSNITITNLDFSDTGNYTCVASNNLAVLQTDSSPPALLTVNRPSIIMNTVALPVINESQNVNMTCMVFGLPKPLVTWSRFDSNNLTATAMGNAKFTVYETFVVPVTGGVMVHSTIEINNVDGTDTGNYTCSSVNYAHGTNQPADEDRVSFHVLVQTSPVVVSQMSATEIGVRGRNITLAFVVSGDEPRVMPEDVKWYFTDSSVTTEVVSNSQISFSADRLVLTVTNLSISDQGNYTLNATNIIGTGSASVFLDVQISPVVNESEPVVRVLHGADATFQCAAVSEPVHITSWQFNGINLTNSSKHIIAGIDTVSSTLTVTNVSLIDEGNYTCRVSNLHGVDFAPSELQVQVPPVVIKHPENAQVLVTKNVTINCQATGKPPPTIIWLKEGNSTPSTFVTYYLLDASTASSNLTLINANLSDAANYTCMATNNLAAQEEAESMSATITVLYPPQVFPLSQTTYIRNESDSFAVECQAFGIPPPALYWIPGPLNVTTLLGQDNFLIQRSDIERLVNLSSSFTSRFTNTSNSFCTEMTGNGSDPASVCRQQSQIATNESILCPMNTICNSVPCGLDITTSSRINADGRLLSVSKLTICELLKMDEGALTCVAVNNISNVILTPEASAANLIVQVPPLVAPTIGEIVAFRDRSTTLKFIITRASPDVTPGKIMWTFVSDEGLTINVNTANDSRYQFPQDRRSLNITNLRRSDSGIYTLTATNEAGVHSAMIRLTVEALPDIEEFLDDGLNVTSGDKVELPCYANGEPLQSVKWDFFFMGQHQYTIEYLVNDTGGPIGLNFTSLVPGLSRTDLQSMYTIAEPNRTSRMYGLLTINNINILQAGEYKCNLTNIYGSENRTTRIAVQLFPSVVKQPTDRICVQGGDCLVSCGTRGVPAPQIEWFREDGKITPGGKFTITSTSSYSMTNTTLRINPATVEDASEYFCNATNSLVQTNSNASQTANIVVHYPASVVSGLQDTTRNETDSAYFTCSVIGIPRPNITWERANSSQGPFTLLANDSKTGIFNTEAQLDYNQTMVNSTLEVRDLIKENDEAYYRCIARNAVENLIQVENVSTAKLTVQVPPVVTSISSTNPIYRLRNTTVSIKFSLNSRVFPAVQLSNIQWIYTTENSSEILDTSSSNNTRYNFSSDLLSLTITNLQVADDGNYTLRASNEAGIDTATFNLTVYVISKLLVESRTVVGQDEGTVFNLTCVADGIPEPRISWNRNGMIIDPTLLIRLTISVDMRREAFRSDIIGHKGRQWGVLSMLTITNINGDNDDGSYGCQANNIDGILATVQDPPSTLTVRREIINYCENSPCLNGGTCENLESDFLCACLSTHGGRTCANRIIQTEEPRIINGPSPSFLNLFDPVTLTCTSTGIPTPTIRWFKDDVQLPSRRIEGQNLVFLETQLTDRGFYRCEAENSVGEDRSVPAVLNYNNIVQYSAVLSRPLTRLSSSNITEAISLSIDELNSVFGGKPVGNNQFFFVQIQDLSQIQNNTVNVTVPILLTILTSNETESGALQTSVVETVRQFGFDIIVTGRADVTLFDRCPQDITPLRSPNGDRSLDLNITWPETKLGEDQKQPCPCEFNLSSSVLFATRSCGGAFDTGAEWGVAQDEPCQFSVTARRLCLLAMITDPIERADGLDNITRDTDNIGFTEITIAASGTESILNNAMSSSEVADRYINVVNNILNVNRTEIQMSQNTSNSSGRFNAGLGSVIQSINLTNASSSMNITRQNFNIQLTDLDPTEFNSNDFNNEIVTIPQNLLERALRDGTAQSGAPVRIAQSIFANDGLYLGRDIGQREVASSVFDFSVIGQEIRNLTEPINITLRQEMNPDVNRSLVQDIQCTFWVQSADRGNGNWSTEGCRRINSTNISDTEIICQCDHLTSFAILLDVAPRPPDGVVDQVLQIYSIIGCIVSLVCLVITAITYLASPKLRQSEASQLLLNLSFGLMGLYVVFIVAIQGSKLTTGVCAVVGFFVHFFLLVVFFAMAAEAVDLFMKLVIVLGPKIQKFTLKTILVSWVAPMFIVLFCFAPNYNHYTSTFYCGPSQEPFYFGVIIPFGAIYIFNFTIFTVIMISLIRKQRKSNRLSEAKTKGRGSDTKQQFRIAITIAVLFGLGWIFGLAGSQSLPEYIGVPFQIVFTTLVGFQGLFIFLLYVIFSPNARKEWKRWILRKDDSRKGRADHSSTSGAYSSRSRQTKQSTVSNYKRNQLRNSKGGTLYHNVYSSSGPTSGVPQSIAEDYSTYEPAVMSGHDAAIEELKYSIAKNEVELNQTNFLNPLDEDGLSMKSEMDDTQSLMHETTFVLPSQEDDDQYSREEDPSQPEAADTAQTTFINPFASRMEEDVLLPSPSQESSEYLTPGNNGHVSFTMNLTGSQNFTQDTMNSNNDDDTMLLNTHEGTKL